MSADPAIVSSMSALMGALVGGGASLAAAIYTQRYQDRLQRVTREIAKREQVYADFTMTASAAMLNAFTEDAITLNKDQQQMLGILQRLRLFAPSVVVQEGDRVLRSIIEIALEAPVDLKSVSLADLSDTAHQPEILERFSSACRTDLDGLHDKFGRA